MQPDACQMRLCKSTHQRDMLLVHVFVTPASDAVARDIGVAFCNYSAAAYDRAQPYPCSVGEANNGPPFCCWYARSFASG